MIDLEAEGRAVGLLDRLAWSVSLGEVVPLLVELAQIETWLPVDRGELRGLALEALRGRRVGGMLPERLVDAVFEWVG